MIPFFQQISALSLGSIIIILWVRRDCNNDLEKIESELAHEWYLIQSHIWGNDVKNTVKDLVLFIENESKKYLEANSKDPLNDIFSNANNFRILKSRLNELNNSYNSYTGFNIILSDLTSLNMEFKKWIDRTILGVLSFALWGVIGIYFELQTFKSGLFFYGLWGSLLILLSISAILIFRSINYYRKLEKMKSKVRVVKSGYMIALEEAQ